MFQVRKMDHTGDSLLVECEPEDAVSLENAQDEYDKFMDECIRQFGSKPNAFADRGDGYDLFDGDLSDRTIKQVIVQPTPLVGG